MKQLCLLVVCALSSACGLLGGGDDDSSPIIDGDWPVDRPDPNVAPGERVEIHVTGIDAELTDVVLWLGESKELALRPARVDDGDVEDDGDAKITIMAPFLRAGDYDVYFGDLSGPRTGAIPFHVVVPTPRLSKTEAARLFANGLDQAVTSIEAQLANPDPDWQAMWAMQPADTRAKIDAVLASAHDARAVIEEDYLALPADLEPAVQSILDKSGILSGFEMAEDVRTARHHADSVFDNFPHSVALGLYILDATSTTISVVGDTVMIMNVIALFVPGGQAVAVVGSGAELLIHSVRAVVDTFVPTDLYSMEAQGQSDLYDLKSHRFTYWGEFSTENQDTSAVIGGLDNLLASIVGEFMPDIPGVEMLVKDKMKGILTQVFAKLTLQKLIMDYAAVPAPTEPIRIKAPLNMAAYSLSVSDLIRVVPVSAAARTSYEAPNENFNNVGGTPAWAATAKVGYTNRTDGMYLHDTQWPAGADRTTLGIIPIVATAWRWTLASFLYVANRPVQKFSSSIDEVKIHYLALEIGNPNVTDEDSRLLVQDTQFITRSTPAQRTLPILLRDLAGGRADVARVRIRVNGQVQIADLALSTQDMNVTFDLDRSMMTKGVNEIEVTALAGHAITFNLGGDEVAFAMKLTVPAAAQMDKTRDIGLAEGASTKIYISLPPPM